MSIWCSHEHIGTGAFGDDDPNRGNVITYAEGFSNHYPDLTGECERPAGIGLAHIAPWCVPGHDEGDCCDGGEVGPWVRLEVGAREALNFWRKDAEGKPLVESRSCVVVLDEEAALSLRDDLTEWLRQSKVHPS